MVKLNQPSTAKQKCCLSGHVCYSVICILNQHLASWFFLITSPNKLTNFTQWSPTYSRIHPTKSHIWLGRSLSCEMVLFVCAVHITLIAVRHFQAVPSIYKKAVVYLRICKAQICRWWRLMQVLCKKGFHRLQQEESNEEVTHFTFFRQHFTSLHSFLIIIALTTETTPIYSDKKRNAYDWIRRKKSDVDVNDVFNWTEEKVLRKDAITLDEQRPNSAVCLTRFLLGSSLAMAECVSKRPKEVISVYRRHQ